VPFTLVVALISGMERVTGCGCSKEYHEDRNIVIWPHVASAGALQFFVTLFLVLLVK